MIALASTLVISLWVASVPAQRSISVQVNRWLSVQSLGGEVWYLNRQGTRRAQTGDLLTVVNDGLRTGSGSTGTLLVDTGIGTIQLLQDTEIRVQRLDYASDNGHITHLYVPRGQVHVNLRRFTHRGSELEIETPAGVSGVRGTEFGVTVQSDGFTGIVTREGAVAVEAQSRQVLVPAGYQTTIRPGEPPLEPLVQSPPTIDYRIDYRTNGSRRWALLIGQVDLVNRVYVNGEQQQLNYWREFVYEVSAVRGTRVEVTVLSPLNERADYDIALF
ncbi:MAG: FecR domain-containing protein [Leptolyngbyaceae cyanobacterium]